MTAAAVLAELRGAGIVPVLRGDGIAVPGGRLTDAQREAIRRSKPELLALLRAQAANDVHGLTVLGGAHVADPATPNGDPPSSRARAFVGYGEAAPEDAGHGTSEPAIDLGQGEHTDDRPKHRGRDAERHAARLHRFLAAGLAHDRARAAADRLAARDADYGDDRRMCGECSYLGVRGYCLAARVGRLQGASPDLQPVVDILQRCEGFGLRKGLE